MADRTVLLVAFHFPPFRGSSGLQRTLRFAQHLPKFGWRPIVLTVAPRAYDSVATDSLSDLPEGLEVHRAFGLDAARHLSLFGRYPSSLAIPDRWATWRFHAVPMALRLIRENAIRAIWSTYPIATSHMIGHEVARKSGIPWVAEFRDPMWQGEYPPDPKMNRSWREMEALIFHQAARVVVTTPGARSEYEHRFPDDAPQKLTIIENGYDEETFRRAEAMFKQTGAVAPARDRPFTMLHSGVIYPAERDPSQFFAAVTALKKKGLISARTLRIKLRASGNERGYASQLATLQIADIVRLEPAVDYVCALREMLAVDSLLILQASNCNAQVPAKLYEYLRAQRPILALTDPVGDTAKTLVAANTGVIASLESATDIEAAILSIMDQSSTDTWRRPASTTIQQYSRHSQTGHLAAVLKQLCD